MRAQAETLAGGAGGALGALPGTHFAASVEPGASASALSDAAAARAAELYRTALGDAPPPPPPPSTAVVAAAAPGHPRARAVEAGTADAVPAEANADLLNDLSLALLSLRRHEEAAHTLRRAAAAAPASVPALGNLAMTLLQLGTQRHLDEAVGVSEQALALAPADGRLLHNTGNLLSKLERKGEADVLWRRAARALPSVVETPLSIAISLGERGRVRGDTET